MKKKKAPDAAAPPSELKAAYDKLFLAFHHYVGVLIHETTDPVIRREVLLRVLKGHQIVVGPGKGEIQMPDVDAMDPGAAYEVIFKHYPQVAVASSEIIRLSEVTPRGNTPPTQGSGS